MDVGDWCTGDLPFTVADHGRNFTVCCFDEYIVNVPKRPAIESELEEIARVQNECASISDSILPCTIIEDCLIMERVPGIRGDRVPDDVWATVATKRDDVYRDCRRHGYHIRGTARENVFWDDGGVYLIDVSHVDSTNSTPI